MTQTPRPTTRTRILDAAENLISVHGYEGTSVREITRVAEANVAAVHYHFGSKENVLRGVIDRVASLITKRWRELLDATYEKSEPEPPSVEDLVDAFVRADIEVLLELHDRATAVAHLVGRTLSDQTPWIQAMAEDQFAEARLFLPPLRAALPHLSLDEVGWRFVRMVGVTIDMYATWPDSGMSESDAERFLDRIVTFLSAGFRASMPERSSGP